MMANLASKNGASSPRMAHATSSAAADRNGFQSLFEPIRDEMRAVEERLKVELRNDHAFVDELVRHSFRMGGKRLRPALVLLSCKLFAEPRREHVVLGAVVEMIHTATLVHDDVLDEAAMRRHLATLNSRWSNEASVLVGDYLFTHAFYLASTLETTFACTTIGRATNIVCEGELRQIHSRGNHDLDEDEYLRIIEAKTAELCACCCRLGSHYAGAPREAVEALARFGRDLGTAFQVADDMLDLLGDEKSAGKSLGTDLEKQKPTLPVIRALTQLEAQPRKELLSLLRHPEGAPRAALLRLLGETDAIEYTRRRAAQFAERARRELSSVPNCAARDTLERLTELVIERSE